MEYGVQARRNICKFFCSHILLSLCPCISLGRSGLDPPAAMEILVGKASSSVCMCIVLRSNIKQRCFSRVWQLYSTSPSEKENIFYSTYTEHSVYTVYNVHSAQEELMPEIPLDLIGCMLGVYSDFISKANYTVCTEYGVSTLCILSIPLNKIILSLSLSLSFTVSYQPE